MRPHTLHPGAPTPFPPWRNPRKGRDQILPSGNLGQGCSFLYPGPSEAAEEGAAPILRQRDGQFEAFYRVESAIRKEVTRILMDETGV